MVEQDGFLKHQVKSFSFAIEGVVFSFQKGTHFKIHTAAAMLVTILGFIYSINFIEWLLVITLSTAVLASEAINTAIEEACDVLHPEHHPGLKLAKHCAAGGVLIFSIGAALIGVLIFVPKIFLS